MSLEALEEAKALIRDKLSFYKTKPLGNDWFAIFIDAYIAKLRKEDGNKQILGFWVHLHD